jgi:hypothetical protein
MPMTPEDEDLAKLLPFYVNGTLSAADCARVDAALAVSVDLRSELSTHNMLAQIVKAGGTGLTIEQGNTEDNLATVMAQLPPKTRDVKSAFAQQPAQREGLASVLSFLNPKNWHPAVALGLALAVAVQAGVIGGLGSSNKHSAAQIAALEKQKTDLEFQLASGPGGEQKVGSIMIQIKDGASWEAVADLLTEEGLSIVDGPSDGAITLSSVAKGAELDAQINRLKSSPLVSAADKVA